ncbi:carboxymuconolactone decarboxylase family protein [Natranaerofaba carboxydovora]|uniref:carboxymuconolactone decarboxylase family protein n=1 Tax=Natranaerofaba carboxydovora TaxID=2742683 RepID=UPI001F12EED4|nr:carboxymuconolactone decarboxylase family protein [Natranaerofaba carboxydovora]UMZ72915.1 Carboxymuconolactone decarboxylase family protein [Natranaerofaba carboxydovora]
MENERTYFNQIEKEYLAIGASIGSGCLHCLDYHLKKARSARITDSEIDTALAIAEDIKQKTLDDLRNRARNMNAEDGQKDQEDEEILPTNKNKILAAFGAALGTNNSSELKKVLNMATNVGLTKAHIAVASQIVRKIKKNAEDICGKTVLDHFSYLDNMSEEVEAGAMCGFMNGQSKDEESPCCGDVDDEGDENKNQSGCC